MAHQRIGKNQPVRAYDLAHHYCSQLRVKFLVPSMVHNTTELSILYVAWTTVANWTNLRRTNNRKLPQPCSATTHQSRTCQTSVFTCLQNSWTTELFSHCTDHASHEPRVTCLWPWPNCWFLTHPLQWSLYGQRFHVEGEAQRCRLGCPDEPDSLSHHNECPLLHNLLPRCGGTKYSATTEWPSFPRLVWTDAPHTWFFLMHLAHVITLTPWLKCLRCAVTPRALLALDFVSLALSQTTRSQSGSQVENTALTHNEEYCSLVVHECNHSGPCPRTN